MKSFLFGEPGDWCSRHQKTMVLAVIALTLLSQWLVDAVTGPLLP